MSISELDLRVSLPKELENGARLEALAYRRGMHPE
jgi:hypothetical protein